MDDLRSDLAHLHRRAGFGARPAELDAAVSAGYEASVESLLAGLDAPDPGGDAVVAPALRIEGRAAGRPGTPERKAQLLDLHQQEVALQTWWAQRMISTSTPLREKLTLVWHGHFATGLSKVHDAELMYEQNQVLRSLGGGSFKALTTAVAKGGAMMRWLDTATDKKTHPNENFARELMELFTLGVGNYSEDDVLAASRAFTGWVTNRATGTWRVQAAQHDSGTKTFLGQTGDLSGDDIIHIAVTHPASARFVLAKLWSHFAYPVTPADPVVGDILPAYGSGLDVASSLRAIFLHPGFRSPAARQGLVKQPMEYLVGAARALGLDASVRRLGVTPTSYLRVTIPVLSTTLAQTPLDPPNVGGWGQNVYWLNTATALARLDAAALLAGRADLAAVEAVAPSARPGVVANLLGLDGWGPTTAAALNHTVADPPSLVAAALNSPEYVLA